MIPTAEMHIPVPHRRKSPAILPTQPLVDWHHVTPHDQWEPTWTNFPGTVLASGQESLKDARFALAESQPFLMKHILVGLVLFTCLLHAWATNAMLDLSLFYLHVWQCKTSTSFPSNCSRLCWDTAGSNSTLWHRRNRPLGWMHIDFGKCSFPKIWYPQIIHL